MVHLSRGIRCIRIFLIALNIIFLLCGLALLGLGFYIVANGKFNAIFALHNIVQALGNSFMNRIATGLIVLGICVIGLAVFGCFGSIYKKRVFLYIYASILTAIILAEFSLVIVILKSHGEISETYHDGFKLYFTNAYAFNQTQNIAVIEQIEREFQCCGVDSPVDYDMIDLEPPIDCYTNENSTSDIFITGCSEALTIWIWNNLPSFFALAASMLLIEIVGIIWSLMLGVISHYVKHDDQLPNRNVQT